jgi:TRAP-type C4-dicarboxylate transport system substrate-binding protein
MQSTMCRRAMPIVLTMLLASCSSASGGGGEAKSGEVPAPRVIKVATSQSAGDPTNAPLEEFIKQLAKLSGGSLKVEALYDHEEDKGGDGAVITDLRNGAVDIAIVPARAWSEAGATSISALQTPFLIKSDEHLNAVASDSKVAGQLMASLSALGVTGLALYPEALRHLFGFKSQPILTPDNLVGRQVRGPDSADIAAVIAALGGTFVSPSFDDFTAGRADGTIMAAESSYLGAFTEFPGDDVVATGNLVLYAKMTTLAVNSKFLQSLASQQQEAILGAADASATWSITHHATEADGAEKFCGIGGTIVDSDAQQTAAFVAAVSPIVDKERQDASMSELIDGIAALAPTTSAAAPHCAADAAPAPAPTATGPAADDIVADGGDLPNGTYRFQMTAEFLSQYPDGDLSEAGVVSTYTLDDGHWSLEAVGTDGSTFRDTGIYQVIGHDLYWQYDVNSPPQFGPSAHLTWQLDSDGSITWVQVEPKFKDYIFGLPWVHVSG